MNDVEQVGIDVERIRATYRRSLEDAENARGSAVSALQRWLEVGEMLIEAKARVPAGSWLTWLAENLPEINRRMASKCMLLALNGPRVAHLRNSDENQSVRNALMLCAPSAAGKSERGAKRKRDHTMRMLFKVNRWARVVRQRRLVAQWDKRERYRMRLALVPVKELIEELESANEAE